VPPDKETLRRIASITGGRFFEAVSSEDAEQIYNRIGTRLTSRPEKREVTVAFAGGAFVLLVVGGALSLVWFGRLP
jgi:Ca-activated chloride channel family protein